MATPDTAHPDQAAPAALEPAARGPRRHVRWATYAWGSLILASLILAVPLALGSIGRQLIAPPENEVYTFVGGAGAAARTSADASYLNLGIVSLDESKKTVTLRLSGHRACTRDCPAYTLRLYSLSTRSAQQAGLPPSVAINLTQGAQVLSETVDLPVAGIPSLYPFDRYTLELAGSAALADPAASGVAPLSYPGSVTITLDSDLPRHILLPPEYTAPPTLDAAGQTIFPRAATLRFVRPLHLQVLTCLLVALIAAAALLSVCTEPLRRLIVGVGSVVLSVWGVRQILIADAPPAITAVDLLLSGVILILLYGITVRVLLELRRSGWDGVHRLIRDG